jgi:stearoyl-CoA desaturase (delta-9 desaturase)
MTPTSYAIACAATFVVAYGVNTVTVSVGYHRGLAHGAVELSPWAERLLVSLGNWLTGVDPKAWVCMHRMHHLHADTELDPHSPAVAGVVGVLEAQHQSYKAVLLGLAKREPAYMQHVEDLDFDVSWLNRARLWFLPHLLHLGIAIALGVAYGWWLLGALYFVGLMSHPVEGWVVNAVGHSHGSRNFDTPDHARNNLLVAWLMMGEGLQNNHHAYPTSARFSHRPHEVDPGWLACLVLERLGALRIVRSELLPPAGRDTPIGAAVPSQGGRRAIR